MNKINRMLSAGLIETKLKKFKTSEFTPDISFNEMIAYVSTSIGRSVLARAQEKNNFSEVFSDFCDTDEGNTVFDSLKTPKLS